ncbi:MAG: chromosomal replication initiator protein DnaA [Treponema sp.]|jgi:chromosomal replication initiator protein|nr:chromosomal replication initiator protein DnaA [Treponema sp.]
MAVLDYEGVWKETLIQLQTDLGGEEFSGWFSDITYLRYVENNIIIGVPNEFHRDKIKSNYQNIINSKFKQISGENLSLKYEIIDNLNINNPISAEIQAEKAHSAIRPSKNSQSSKKSKGVHPQMRDDYTFERYVIGENNRFAYNAASAISKNPGKAYNPLLIFGGVGLGKTHLMQAIGNFIFENSDNNVIYTTSETFLNEYLEGLAQNKMNTFKNKFRHTDVLLIDDIQFLRDKPGVQEELFHTFNALLDQKKQLVFTCDRPVSELKNFSDRLISRFDQCLKVDLMPPRYEERCAIIKKTAELKNTVIPDDVIDFVSKNISSNVRDLISALNTLIAYTELMGKPITLEIAQQRLRDTFSASHQSNQSIDNIIRVVAENYKLSPNDLKGKKKSQNIVSARQLAIFIAREMTDYSTTELGQEFGGRDHTTIMHSISKIKEKLLIDPTLDSSIISLKRAIKEYNAKY